MNIVSEKRRDIIDTVWSVLTSFGYCEVENSENFLDEARKEKGKFCYFDKNEIVAVNTGEITPIAKAETLAIGIESAATLGIDFFYARVGDDEVLELGDFFGFEDVLEKGTKKNEFLLAKDGQEFAKGEYNQEFSKITFNIDMIIEALLMSGADMSPFSMSKSLVFAEPNAEGVAYETAYNLRLNGCIMELYTESGSIDDAENYAKNNGISCIIRAFADGKLMIRDYAKDEIIETTIMDFLGYYEDDEDECDCGHHHHHGENCSCH